jgi:ribonuclease MRP protein subunit RMP1
MCSSPQPSPILMLIFRVSAFTQLAADNQHAPLGLMLLAVLAHIRRLVSDLVPSDHPSSNADSSVAGTVNPTTPASRPILTPSSLETADPDQDVDMGVAISRNDLALPKAPSKQSDRLATVETLPKDTKARKSAKSSSKDVTKDTSKESKERKKKKKKTGDAFSSLFSSL